MIWIGKTKCTSEKGLLCTKTITCLTQQALIVNRDNGTACIRIQLRGLKSKGNLYYVVVYNV